MPALASTTPLAVAAARAANLPQSMPATIRAAAEGVPMRAIARIFHLDYATVVATLNRAVRTGQLVELPSPDWHSATKSHVPIAHNNHALPLPADLEFLCRENFRLTNLEAGFLAVLLRCLFAEKEKLHAVVESQRQQRPLRPVGPEVTDPKMVDVMICKLRKKMLAHSPKFVIRTSWGKGYFLDAAAKAAIMSRLVPSANSVKQSRETIA